MTYRILIVEDDDTIAEGIRKHLESWGFEAACAKDFRNILPEFLSFDPGLVLMDISLPFFDGYHWCGEIRKLSKVPIVFLSSASDNMNIIMAMNMGGDDFIAKPFDLSVLTAKIRAVLRRAFDVSGQMPVIEHRGAVLDLSSASLFYRDEKIDLTKNDYRILQTLLENKGWIVSRSLLMQRLWETDCFVDDNTLTVNMTRLRKKLEAAGLTGFITTKKGLGYLVE